MSIEKECSYPFIESSGPVHLSTRAVKYDLNFTSLPWILSVPLKDDQRVSEISGIDFELQLMNVNFILSAIIWGDGKTHFTGISVDMNKEKHIFYDGMAKERMVILRHDQSLIILGASTSIVVCQEGRTDTLSRSGSK